MFCFCFFVLSFLGAFAKFRKATISFVMSVCSQKLERKCQGTWGGFRDCKPGGLMSLQILKWNTLASEGWSGIQTTQFLELWNRRCVVLGIFYRFVFKYACKWELMLFCVLRPCILQYRASCPWKRCGCIVLSVHFVPVLSTSFTGICLNTLRSSKQKTVPILLLIKFEIFRRQVRLK